MENKCLTVSVPMIAFKNHSTVGTLVSISTPGYRPITVTKEAFMKATESFNQIAHKSEIYGELIPHEKITTMVDKTAIKNVNLFIYENDDVSEVKLEFSTLDTPAGKFLKWVKNGKRNLGVDFNIVPVIDAEYNDRYGELDTLYSIERFDIVPKF